MCWKVSEEKPGGTVRRDRGVKNNGKLIISDLPGQVYGCFRKDQTLAYIYKKVEQ